MRRRPTHEPEESSGRRAEFEVPNRRANWCGQDPRAKAETRAHSSAETSRRTIASGLRNVVARDTAETFDSRAKSKRAQVD